MDMFRAKDIEIASNVLTSILRTKSRKGQFDAPSRERPRREVYLKIAGRMVYLWRAVDAEGEVLDVLVQSRGDYIEVETRTQP